MLSIYRLEKYLSGDIFSSIELERHKEYMKQAHEEANQGGKVSNNHLLFNQY